MRSATERVKSKPDIAFVEKPLKILLLLITSLMLLTVSAVIALSYWIDPNDYKPQMIAFVKANTGREMDMPGDIALSFFPWLGISTGQIVLKNTPEFQGRPLATIEQSDIKVRLIPLFNKNIQVNTIVLKGLNLNLIKNKQGIRNWDDLLAAGGAQTETPAAMKQSPDARGVETASKTLAALAINGIVVEQARIDWDDQDSGKHIELTELDLKVDAFTWDRPVDINLSSQIATGNSKPLGSLTLATTLRLNNSLTSFELTDLELNYVRKHHAGYSQPLAARLTAGDIVFEQPDQSLKLTGMQLNYGELTVAGELSGQHMIDAPAIEGPIHIKPFNPARFMKQLNFSVPKMQDSNAFSRLAIQFHLMATAESVGIQQMTGQLDETLIKGAGTIQGLTQPAVHFEVSLDDLDADRYLPVRTKTAKPMATPAMALAAGLSNLPAETLSEIDVSGDVLLDQLKINGLTMHGLHFRLNGHDGNVTVHQSIDRLYQGSYSGDLSLKPGDHQPRLLLNEKMEQVHLEPMLKDLYGKANIRGVVNASVRLQGQGHSTKEIKDGLAGRLDFLLKDAALKGLNIQKMIDAAAPKNRGSDLDAAVENDQTVFSEITGTANLSDGIVQNHDLVGKSPRFRVEGSGQANLNTDALDYTLLTKLVKKKATPVEPEQFHSTPVVIHIGGTFDQPSYSLDVSALLTEKNKAKIDKLLDKKKEKIDKLLNKLDKKLGPGAGDLLKNIFKH